MTNAELKNDADLKLFLASLGTGRRVLFDESLQQAVRSKWSAARGLPLWWMLGQAGAGVRAAGVLVQPKAGAGAAAGTVPRSSPVEFAVSMGDLYEKAGATGAATEAARRRLQRVLVRDGGLPQQTVEQGPDAIVAALEERFGGGWASVGEHLREAALAADVHPKPGGALALVRALARRCGAGAESGGTGEGEARGRIRR